MKHLKYLLLATTLTTSITMASDLKSDPGEGAVAASEDKTIKQKHPIRSSSEEANLVVLASSMDDSPYDRAFTYLCKVFVQYGLLTVSEVSQFSDQENIYMQLINVLDLAIRRYGPPASSDPQTQQTRSEEAERIRYGYGAGSEDDDKAENLIRRFVESGIYTADEVRPANDMESSNLGMHVTSVVRKFAQGVVRR